MATSIYHFFKFLVDNADQIKIIDDLEDLKFDKNMISSKIKGRFPDLAIKINTDGNRFTGGELVEVKGSKGFCIASFNSTIPTGKKNISDIVADEDSNGIIRTQMEKAGNKIDSMPIRDVYYLISGKVKKNDDIKVVLIHGSFFETIPSKELIQKAFSNILTDIGFDTTNLKMGDHISQHKFSQTRKVDGASVKIRFRIMTEASSDANILNHRIYPNIKSNTLTLCIPYKTKDTRERIVDDFKVVFGNKGYKILELEHKINQSTFIAFQVPF